MSNPAPSPSQRQEMRSLIAILTAGTEMLQGALSPQDYGELIGPVIAETWPDEPLEAIPALSALALRLATWVAQAWDLDGVEAVLRVLAAEIDGPSPSVP